MSNRGLSLVDAQRIVKEALAAARKKNLPALAIALLDSGGHLKAFASEDDAGTQRGQIATGKANAALGMGFGTGQFYSLVKDNVLPEMFAVCINGATNGLLRQYFPKGMDLSNVHQNRLNAVARRLNERPRETLQFYSPAEKFSECVASTG